MALMLRPIVSLCVSLFVLYFPAWPEPNAPVRTKNVLANIPLSFEQNQGQTAGAAKYLSRGPGYTMYLASEEIVVEGGRGKLRIKLLGGNRHARLEPLDRLPGISNYFIGNDRSKWRIDVLTTREWQSATRTRESI
jgi:hypothetical protein